MVRWQALGAGPNSDEQREGATDVVQVFPSEDMERKMSVVRHALTKCLGSEAATSNTQARLEPDERD